MTIVRYIRKQFEVPDEGLIDATVSEIRDLGMVPGFNGEKQAKLRFIYETDIVGAKGEPLKVFQRFNNTLHPQSFLYKAITDITGEEPGAEYDTDKLIGKKVQLLIKHNEGANGVVYANVENILRPKTEAEEASEKRIKDIADKVKAQVRKKPSSGNDDGEAPTPQPVAGKPNSGNGGEKAKPPKSGPVRKTVVARTPQPATTPTDEREVEITDEDVPF